MGEAGLMDGFDELDSPAREHFLDVGAATDDPLRQARAEKVRAEYESSTVSGMNQLLVRTVTRLTAAHQAELAAVSERAKAREAELLARDAELHKRLAEREAELIAQNERLHQRLNDSINTTSQSFSDLAALPAIVADHGKQLLEAQSAHLEKMREPVQPRPSGSETAGDVFKHLFSQLREVAGDVFSNNPELRKRAQRLLGGAIERGEAMLGPAATDDGEPQAQPEAGSDEERIDTMPLKQVFGLFEGLPSEVISRFAAELGLKEPFEASWRQMRQLLATHGLRSAK